jgi:uncharacterized protein (DUF488 family)
VSTADQPEPRTLFTIGHSNHSEEKFLELLRSSAIDVLVDVRSQPYCRYATHFNVEPIRNAVLAAGIKYLPMGKELGGRPDEPEYFDADGHVLYRRVADSARFLDGITRLEEGIAKFRVAIMCSEEDPSVCHRHLLVSHVLAQRGVEVRHIRGDGRTQTEAELKKEHDSADARQPMLFAELERDSWRSLRSVLPKPQQPSSSES